MNTTTLLFITTLSIAVTATHATATEVIVEVQNLSSETIRTYASGFPKILSPGESESVTLNFPDHTSDVNITYTGASGKSCNFRGWHKYYGGNTTKWDASSTGSQSYNNCGAVRSVSRWSSPFNYRLRFWMTD
ncbi:hypothetical protein [Pseudomonas sp. NPDC090201]|uniref:hypothetical protein n=1 Tax=Pseudomonas sp. NPDC090201 TaxID=3364475 RepID=UPI00381C1607